MQISRIKPSKIDQFDHNYITGKFGAYSFSLLIVHCVKSFHQASQNKAYWYEYMTKVMAILRARYSYGYSYKLYFWLVFFFFNCPSTYNR